MTKIQMITADGFQTSERFYALPKIFFESDCYKQMRIDTKVAYSILKDRLSLSLKNSREVIISFLMEQTGLSRQETVASIEELEAFGLVGFASNGDFRLKEV